MIDLIGAGTESTARVFGCFFLGLSLGAAIARTLAARFPRHPFILLASAEILIALCSIPIFLLPVWVSPANATSSFVSFVLTAVVIIPPALLMGLFLPVLIIALDRLGYRLGGGGLFLYAANTIGGVAGLTAILIWSVPTFGLSLTWVILIAGNVVTAAAFCFMHRFIQQPSLLIHHRDAKKCFDAPLKRRSEKRTILLLSFLSGWLILAWEIIALQALLLQVTITFHSPGAILACVLLLLATGAFSISLISHRITASKWLPSVVVLTATAGAFTPILFFYTSNLGLGAPIGGSLLFWVRLLLLTLLIFGPVFLAASFWFPLLTEWWDHSNDQHGASRWGWLLALNGIGGLLGAECAYRLLLPALGPFGSMGALALVTLAALFVIFTCQRFHLHQFPITTFASCALGSFLIWAGFAWFPTLPVVNPHARFELRSHWSDRTGNLAVVERPDIGRGLLLNNQYMLGTTSLAEDKLRQTQIALAAHPDPQRVATLGMATGISAGAAVGVEGVKAIEVFELSASVIAAANFFNEYNRNLLKDPKVRIHNIDARNGIGAFQDHFDVVIGDLFLPWGIGEARLFSIEHFVGVYQALSNDGIFVQWLPLYQLGLEELHVIINTFNSVFSNSWQLRLHLREDQPVFGLVGRKENLDTPTKGLKFHSHYGNSSEVLEQLWPSLVINPQVVPIEALNAFSSINTLSNMLVERLAVRRIVTDPARKTYLNYGKLGL